MNTHHLSAYCTFYFILSRFSNFFCFTSCCIDTHRPVFDIQGGMYYWNIVTNETTLVGALKPTTLSVYSDEDKGEEDNAGREEEREGGGSGKTKFKIGIAGSVCIACRI